MTVGAKMMGAVAALEWTHSGGHVDDVVALSMRALEGGLLSERDPNLLTLAALLPMIVGDRDEALQIFDVAMADAHRRGSLFMITGMYLWRGFTLMWRGDLVDAEEQLSLRVRPGRGVGLRPGHRAVERGPPRVVPRGARRPRGRPPRARPRPRAGRPLGRRALLVQRAAGAAGGRGPLRRRGRGRRRVRAALRPLPQPGGRALGLAQGRRDRRARDEEEGGRAGRPRSSTARGTGVRRERSPARCACSGARGRRRDRGVEEAVEVASHTPTRLELAKSLAALGVTRRRAGRPDYAREPLARAHELAEVCGAERLLASIRTEMLAGRRRPASRRARAA